MSDPLTQLVTLLRPGAPYAKIATASGAWRVRREEDSIVLYSLILEGRALLEVDERAPILLEEGDFVLIPAARRFTLSSPDPVLPLGQFTEPVILAPGQVQIGDPDLPVTTQQLVGHCTFGARDAALLLTLLPDLVVIRGEARLGTLIRLVADEARAARPGREVVLERLLEVLLIEAFRASGGISAPPGLLRGLGDPHLSIALRALHADPARPWTVAELARAAGLSRSAFFARFEREVGSAPMAYLTGWRMSLAKDRLRRGEGSLAEIGAALGYGSASAFNTAFAREVGKPPGQYASWATQLAPEEAPA
ncbi:AraC family transcriptional regulator [Cereibacter changlensis JA139]|uniref:AraC family transcriptional regulator n=2 Tax=Cereibacter changlensis TaxID=402884 RepID=A0A2T4JNL4_9RHOB|nr:AraC family transcriptional regulator [Cereibacter changlensis]PTE19476.1 AraC family transcriptional regulator [Cereibacter changlensis JA139]PZX48637.1 AraC-like DNA-binding protein [Cereibacter changlensis]